MSPVQTEKRRALFWGLGCIAIVAALAGLAAHPRSEYARDPDELEARLDQARVLVERRDLEGVWRETQYVLSRSPGHPRALAYQALVRLAAGQGDAAVSMLREALATNPDLLEAHQNLVYAYARLGRRQEAEAAIADTSRRFPGEGERLRQALAQFTGKAGGSPTGPDRR